MAIVRRKWSGLSPVWCVARVLAVLIFLNIQTLYAASATWSQSPVNGDWNEPNNWMPATVPNGPTDVATFGTSNLTNVQILSNIYDGEISGITFGIGASAFTLTASTDGFYLLITISGAGIVNNSGVTQHFVADRFQGQTQLRFINSSAAGSSTIFTNTGTNFQSYDPFVAAMAFFDTSTAGSGTFTNNPGPFEGAVSGYITFEDNATAGNGTFTNNGGGSYAQGGSTRFSGNASAGQGSFVNKGATAPGFQLYLNSGFMWFMDSATAANATVTNNGASASLALGGSVVFYHTSTAGSATFVNNPGEVGGASGGTIGFSAGTASNGTFLNKRGTVSGAYGGVIRFYNEATADHGDFTNQGGSFANQGGGYIRFTGDATAGHGTFTNDGGTVSGGLGGSTDFLENSTAGNATLIANGGLNGGQGGQFQFAADSTGSTSRVVLLGNGSLTISAHNVPGVTIGSLEGSGNVLLGNNNLTVGSRNTSTSFSGVIQNGGSLTKLGTGTLTLSGATPILGQRQLTPASWPWTARLRAQSR